MIPQLRWAAALLLSALVLWAPLPFGSAPAWAVSILQWGAAAALALAACAARDAGRLRAVGWFLALFLGLPALAVLQSFPLPTGVVRLLSPAHGRLFGSASEVLDGGWAYLSLSPDLSRRTAVWWLALAATFLAAALVSERRGRRRLLLGAVVVSALFQVGFGWRERVAMRRTIWGVEVPQPPGRLRGSFINPDHAAFLFLLALAVTFAWTWWALRTRRASDWDGRLLRAIVPIVLWFALIGALLLTGSRAAVAAAVAGTLVQLALLVRGPGRWWAAGGATALLAAALWMAAILGGSVGFGRLVEISAYELIWNHRWLAYGAMLRLWTSFPLIGTGAGSFREAFPMVEPEGLYDLWRHAHSDWLELLVTTGLLGFGLMCAALLLLIRRLRAQVGEGGRSEDRARALAALGVLAVAGAHSALDFSLTMPANAFVLAVLLGCVAGAPAGSRTDAQPGRERRSNAAGDGGRRSRRPPDRDHLEEVISSGDLRRERDPGSGAESDRVDEGTV